MIINLNHKFIFVHIYKTAGTSIQRSLQVHPAHKNFYDKVRLAYLYRVLHPHATAIEIRNKIGPLSFNEMFKFAFVRNPWDWQVSLYEYMRQNTNHYQHNEIIQLGSFTNYIYWRLDNLTKLQSDFLYDGSKCLMNYIGRYENLGNDFQYINEMLGFTRSLTYHIHKTKREHYHQYYNTETKNIVARIYMRDIDNFQYIY